MGEITKVVVEFLTSNVDCTLISNEVTLQQVYQIAFREEIATVNPEGKRFEQSTKLTPEHYIKYE